MRVVLLFGPLAPHLAASAVAHWGGSRTETVPWPLVLKLLASAELCSTGPASPAALPDHLENHLIWVDSNKVIPLACCRMSFDRLLGTRKFPTTLVTLSLQLWNWIGYLYRYIRSELSMLLKGFCELLFQVSTKALGSMGYLTINTQSNRVVIIYSIITRIFLTLCNAWTVTFQPVSIRHFWFIYVVHSVHVPVTSCSI